jgi:heptosyltransferase-3
VESRGKILVIRGGAIGDFILTLPAIAALRSQFPEAYLEILGYPHIVQLARMGGLVDYARSIEARSLAGFFARNGALAEDMVDYFSEFDLIISYLYDPDEIFRSNVARCTPGQFIAGPHRPQESAGVHATKVFLKPLERLAIFAADLVPRLNFAPRDYFSEPAAPCHAGAEVSAHSRPAAKVMALHPGSGSERKNWPERCWADLVQHLIVETEFKLLLVGGEAEVERLQRLAAALPLARARVAQSVPLTELAGLLAGCAGFIGHDSGISHLAAAVGVPGLLLWGDSAEEIWRPPSKKMTILRHAAGLEKLPVQEVVRHLDFENWLALSPAR